VNGAVTCHKCGAKVRRDRNRCPRCRAHLTAADPAAAAASSRSLARAAAVVVGLFVLILLGLWIRREPAPATQSAARNADPLAARHSGAARPPQPGAPATAEATEHPFIELAGEGSVAYEGGDYQGALAKYLAAVKKNPDDAESLSNLGQVLVRLNRTSESIPYFERAVAILPGRWAYQFNLARAQGLLGQTDEAITTYRRAQQLFPDDYATTFNLAMALHHKGDEASAVEQYQKAIALQPDDASFRKALGISLEQLRKAPEAAAAYEEYLRLSPAASDADKVRARIARLQGGVAPVAALAQATVPAPPAAPAVR
jgi:tetratricopeptide (TPR) repeat protein